jgi:hypothetical protein
MPPVIPHVQFKNLVEDVCAAGSLIGRMKATARGEFSVGVDYILFGFNVLFTKC